MQERGEGERGEDKRVVAVDEKPPIPLLRKKVFHSRDAPSQSCSASSSDDGTGKAQAHLTNASRPSPVVMVEEGGGSKLRVKVEKVKEEKQDDVAAAEKKRVKEKQAAALEAERAEEERQAAVDATRKAKEQLLEAAEKCKALENRAKAMAAVAEAKKKVAEELSKAVPYAAMKRSSNDLSTNRPTNQMLVCIDLTSPPPSPRNKSAPSLSSGADGGHSPDANGYLSPGHKGADSSCSSSSSPSSSSGSLQSNFEQAGAGRGMAREGAVGSRSDDAAGGASSSKLRDQPEMPQQYQYNRGEPKPQKRSKKAPRCGPVRTLVIF